MSKIKGIISAEWRHLKKERILLVSVIVMLFIPIMYGGFFLGSIWNPYGNTKDLPVAIVNEDKGAKYDGKDLNVGSDIVKSLKDNHDMGWHFVSADEASKGLDSGKYYMRVLIPDNFSEDATSVTSANPIKSKIYYTITPSKNYVASLLTKQAANQIKSTVSSEISSTYVSTILSSINKLKVVASELSSGANQLQVGSTSLNNGVSTYTAGVDKIASAQTTLSEGILSLQSGSNAISGGLQTLSASLPSSSDIAKINGGITRINSSLLQLKNSTSSSTDSTIAGYMQSISVDSAKLTTTTDDYLGVKDSIESLNKMVATDSSTVTISRSDLAGLLTLVKDSGNIASTTTDLLSNLGSLNNALGKQQTDLATNTAGIYNGYNELSQNLLALTGGVSKLSGATGQLLQGSQQLSNGLTTAYNGSLLLGSNLNMLSQNSTSLRSGSSQVSTGAQELASATSEISKQLSLQSTNDSTAGQIVTPVESNESIIGNVPNYGYALAPYVLSLGLYVGAIVFCVIYPVRRSFSEHKNAVGWWLSKISVAAVVAVGQALVLDAIMYLFLGLHPNNCWQFISMSALTSITYMSLVLLLSIALDNVGRFIAMLILVLQLGSAEGVFPLVLSPKFFQVLNPFLPMTYSIRGFRQAISSGLGDAVYSKNALILICVTIVLNIILILFMKHRGSRQFSHKSIEA